MYKIKIEHFNGNHLNLNTFIKLYRNQSCGREIPVPRGLRASRPVPDTTRPLGASHLEGGHCLAG